MKRDPEILINDIKDSIAKIEEYVAGADKELFSKDYKSQDAVLKRIEIIGEAAKNLPPDFRNSVSEIPWKQVAGMRDILVHDYFGVDVNKVWNVVKNDIPDLKQKIYEIKFDNSQGKLL